MSAEEFQELLDAGGDVSSLSGSDSDSDDESESSSSRNVAALAKRGEQVCFVEPDGKRFKIWRCVLMRDQGVGWCPATRIESWDTCVTVHNR